MKSMCWRRLVLTVLGATLTLAALLLAGAYASIFYAHYKAQHLMAEVRNLEPGKTPIDYARKLVERYSGEEYDAHSYFGVEGSDKRYTSPNPCLGDALSYAVYASPPLILARTVQAFPMLQRLGLHPWFVSLVIHQKDGIVTCYSENVMFIRPDGQEVEATASVDLRNPQSLVEQKTYEPDSFVSRNHYHHTLVTVLREASAEQKSRAFKMDLSCTVSLRGCHFPCQIMPLGWLDSLRDHQAHGWRLPEGADDQRCPAH